MSHECHVKLTIQYGFESRVQHIEKIWKVWRAVDGMTPANRNGQSLHACWNHQAVKHWPNLRSHKNSSMQLPKCSLQAVTSVTSDVRSLFQAVAKQLHIHQHPPKTSTSSWLVNSISQFIYYDNPQNPYMIWYNPKENKHQTSLISCIPIFWWFKPY